jgi:hypothetical protein
MGDVHKTNVISLGSCRACDAVVRPGSDFCYNCGGKLNDASAESERIPPIPPPNAELSGRSENRALSNGPGVIVNQKQPGARPRRPSPRRSEPVEVVWRRDEGVGVGFIVLSLGAAAFAVFLVLIAYYLR